MDIALVDANSWIENWDFSRDGAHKLKWSEKTKPTVF
jgi:hypothetical protein